MRKLIRFEPGPLIRATLFRLGSEGHVLAVNHSHYDGWVVTDDFLARTDTTL